MGHLTPWKETFVFHSNHWKPTSSNILRRGFVGFERFAAQITPIHVKTLLSGRNIALGYLAKFEKKVVF